MKWAFSALFLIFGFEVPGQPPGTAPAPDVRTRPVRITSNELAEFALLPAARRQLISIALAVAWDFPWLPYLNGGADPEDGGFDCSGAMYYVMRKAGLDPPRSSDDQMEWLGKHGRLRLVPAEARDLKDASFVALKPGDLLFWAAIGPDGAWRAHHVAMYLGTEKDGGNPVMIDSTDGRSYRGQPANGYGVHDLKMPEAESPSRLVGYGTPPGIRIE